MVVACLKHGETCDHALSFDIDWAPADPEYRGKVLLPVLGDHLGTILERKEIVLDRDHGPAPVLRYHAHIFPLNAEGKSWLRRTTRYRPHPCRAALRSGLLACRTTELNYRRFFAINTLAALRVV